MEISKLFAEIIKYYRENERLSLEELGNRAKLHRTFIGLIEKQERVPTISTAHQISLGLEKKLSDIIRTAEILLENPKLSIQNIAFSGRIADKKCIINEEEIYKHTGLDSNVLIESISRCYNILDTIDEQLVTNNSPKIANLVELANLSSMVGNIIAGGIVNFSSGLYSRNKPHTYPDLIPMKEPARDLELKIALEKNRPKGHLPKSGYYITLRYVLGDQSGRYQKGKEFRGDTVWIWEVKVGYLTDNDFTMSNTPGDSGKTAIIKNEAFKAMPTVYFAENICPFKSKVFLDALHRGN